MTQKENLKDQDLDGASVKSLTTINKIKGNSDNKIDLIDGQSKNKS